MLTYADVCCALKLLALLAPQGVEAGSLKHTRAEANSRPADRESLKKTAAQSNEKWSKMNHAPIKVER
jgi:hypothetical protein